MRHNTTSFVSTLLPVVFSLMLAPAVPGQEPSTAAAPPAYGVSSLLKSAGQLPGKPVVLEGLVIGVCRKSGKEAFLHDRDPNAAGSVRVNNPGTLPIFNRELEGKTIRVTGIVREIRIDKAYLDAWEARTKGVKDVTDKRDLCIDQCAASVSAQATLKKIAGFRERLAKAKEGYLSTIWVEAQKWDVLAEAKPDSKAEPGSEAKPTRS